MLLEVIRDNNPGAHSLLAARLKIYAGAPPEIIYLDTTEDTVEEVGRQLFGRDRPGVCVCELGKYSALGYIL